MQNSGMVTEITTLMDYMGGGLNKKETKESF